MMARIIRRHWLAGGAERDIRIIENPDGMCARLPYDRAV